MSTTLIAVLLLGIALEFIASLAWLPPYFRYGIPLFRKRVSVGDQFDFSRVLSGAKPAEELLDSCGLSIKPISPNEIAVRERVFIVSRSATLHGVIRFIPDRNEVVAWGFVNWSLLFFIAAVALMLNRAPVYVWPVALLIILATSTSKISNFRKFVELTTKPEEAGVGSKPTGIAPYEV